MTEGERWAAQLLDDLRASRFAPLAWIRFLHASFVRAEQRRRERPALARQTLATFLAGTGAWAGIGATGRPGLALAGGLWWAAVCLMLYWHLGMVERPDGRPLAHLGVPNLLCLLRAGFVPALPALSPTAVAIALAAAHATDVADGRLARGRDEITRLGLWLDGAVDGLLLATASVTLATAGLLPGWAAALTVARYALPWVVVAGTYFLRAAAPPREGYVPGRAPGFVLLAGLAVAALELPGGTALVAVGAAGGLLTLAATIARMTSPSWRPRLSGPAS